MTRRDLPVTAFKSQQAWDAWLSSQPAQSKGLWLKLAKKSSGIASVSRQEAVDTALCHGWIDGQLDSFDDKYWNATCGIKGGRTREKGWPMGSRLCCPEHGAGSRRSARRSGEKQNGKELVRNPR